MLKKINSDAIIEEICGVSQKEIVIYGAGGYGRGIYQYLKEKYGMKIKCFFVSSRQYMNCEEIEGIKVIPINEILDNRKQYILIIAVSEQKQDELLELAFKQGFENVYLLLNEFYRYILSQLNLKRLERLENLNFEVHITDHCNLNCKGCYHFSPLSDESFLSVEEFEQDIKRMAVLCKDRVWHITLLGGEPLLHPRVTDFFYIFRKYFKSCELELLTNGLLLRQMDDRFWNACSENDVILSCTRYPVKVDYEMLEKMADSHQLRMVYHNDIDAGKKMLIKYPFDIEGKQPIEWNYAHCTRSNKCITLKHGRLFTCPMAAHAHIAKDFFGLNMELSDKDSIDIYCVQSFEEITNFLITPIPFCRYCNLKIKPEQQEWEVSKREIEEWF